MAFNNRGAHWLSDTTEVVNPYFGDEMLHCGSVTDTLRFQKAGLSAVTDNLPF